MGDACVMMRKGIDHGDHEDALQDEQRIRAIQRALD
jgi:hypothetical protein